MHLLALSRKLEWDFPSSAGRPLRDATRAEPLLSRRAELAGAARELGDDDAHELAARTWRLWMVARDITGGREFLGPVLERSGSTRWRALALYGDGLLAWWRGEREAARDRNEESLSLAGDAEALALASLGLSRIAVDEGDHERGGQLARDARAHAGRVGEAMGQAPLHLEAQARRLAGDLDGAAQLFAASLELNRRIDDPSMVEVELHNLGQVELRRGNVDAAERCFAQLPPATDPYGIALGRLHDASVAVVRGDNERAHDLLGAIGEVELAADDQGELDWLRKQLA